LRLCNDMVVSLPADRFGSHPSVWWRAVPVDIEREE
jgi:hypothetical protein